VERLRNVLLPLGQEFEIISVDDASPDKSWESIKMAGAGVDHDGGFGSVETSGSITRSRPG
jgi:glycosyltransferase involved in cell wall biosynthesis